MKELDALFHDARTDQPVISGGLMAAILDDATRVQETFAEPPVVEALQTQRTSVVSRLFMILGGGMGVSGLMTAGLAGVWIGLAPPSFLPDPAGLATASASLENDPFDGFDLSELMSEDLR